MSDPDPRVTLARPDLADRRLEGLIRAERFAATRSVRCLAASAAIRSAPDAHSEQQDQLLYGEAFETLEESGGWAWGQARRDGYVGFVHADALAPAETAPTHWVWALRSYLFAAPEVKSAPVVLLSMNSLLALDGAAQKGFTRTTEGRWIWSRHLRPLGEVETDLAGVAERFLGAPYGWGGRDSLGLDCSGLVQQAFYACGRACPRDADQQMAAFPRAVERSDLQRGDLVFWRDHVAVMLDAARMIHANGFHMAVTVEPLEGVIARNQAAGVGPPLGFRRP